MAPGCAQVGLEAVPEAAVGVAVGAQGREDGLGVPAVEEQLEAPPIQDAGVAEEEAAGGALIGHLRSLLPDAVRRREGRGTPSGFHGR